jgi:methyltransferase
MVFTLFLSFIILIRIVELIYSTSNEKWLLKMGALEYGKAHYPYMILLHVSFLCALMLEYNIRAENSYSSLLIVLYFIVLAFKLWVLLSLGKYWNTKILRVPGASLIATGPYKYMKHPNYVIVICEIALIPLAFHLYVTAIVFSILNLMMLLVRIKVENKALETGSESMQRTEID